MIRVHRLQDGQWRTQEGGDALRDAAAAADGGDPARAPFWIEAIAPDADEKTLLVDGLDLPRDSVRDALEPSHPPILRELDSHLMTIVHAPEAGDETHTRKVALFLGRGWLVTVVRLELPLLDPLRETMRRNPGWYLHKPERIAHSILRHMCDVFEERVDEMIDCAEELEEQAVMRKSSDTLTTLQQLRRRTAQLTRVVRAQRDVCQGLARGGNPFIPRAEEPYLRDVADHMLRIYDLLEAVRDGIFAARDAHLTAMNTELNVTLRTLTAVATLLLPLSLIAGIFGMNFRSMPLIEQPWGLAALAGVMAVVFAGTWKWLRGRGWL